MDSSANMTATGVVEGGRWMSLTPTQDGGFCFFFGSIPQPVSLMAPVPMPPMRVVDISDEMEMKDNNEATPLSKRQKKRLRAARAALRKKEAVQQVASVQVAVPNVPINNTFAPLRWVRRNASTAQLRNSWEQPAPEVQQETESVPVQKVS